MGEPDKPLTRIDAIQENPAELSEKEWRDRLTPDQFYVCRQKGTEPAYVGRYVKFDKKGTYHCMACDAFLFKSEHKFTSNCGWPAFFAARPGDVKSGRGVAAALVDAGPETVKRREDHSLGMTRVEVSCNNCNSHLGHVFPDGPLPTKERFCINSMAINFRKPASDTTRPSIAARLHQQQFQQHRNGSVASKAASRSSVSGVSSAVANTGRTDASLAITSGRSPTPPSTARAKPAAARRTSNSTQLSSSGTCSGAANAVKDRAKPGHAANETCGLVCKATTSGISSSTDKPASSRYVFTNSKSPARHTVASGGQHTVRSNNSGSNVRK